MIASAVAGLDRVNIVFEEPQSQGVPPAGGRPTTDTLSVASEPARRAEPDISFDA